MLIFNEKKFNLSFLSKIQIFGIDNERNKNRNGNRNKNLFLSNYRILKYFLNTLIIKKYTYIYYQFIF